MDKLLLETVARLVNSHDDRIDQLEEHMSATDDLVDRFAAATDEVARDLADLRDQVANLDPAIAAQFEPLVTRLEGLGADPADPVPAPTT
jgi:ABC-type transporter Mla subunit MlaD